MFLLRTSQCYPVKCSQPQQAEFQSEVLCVQIEYFLGGNLLTNPSAGCGNHAKIVANAFFFASKVVDKLWIGKFDSFFFTRFLEFLAGKETEAKF